MCKRAGFLLIVVEEAFLIKNLKWKITHSINTMIKEFLKDKYVAAFFPSSDKVVKKVTRKIDFEHADVIIEYGPGTGIITKEVLRRMKPNARLIVIERNPAFIGTLQQLGDKRLTVIEGSVTDLVQLLECHHVKNADYIISGIPFSFFNNDEKAVIVENTHNFLNENGTFIVYQHSMLMTKYLKPRFKKVNTSLEIRNIPPMFIMEAEV